MTAEITHWQDHAACAGLDPQMFFPEAGESAFEAKAVCRECPVRTECLEYAIDNDERFGVYGGMTAKERWRLRRNRPHGRPRTPVHGSVEGWHAHWRRGEPACWACADAYSRDREYGRPTRSKATS